MPKRRSRTSRRQPMTTRAANRPMPEQKVETRSRIGTSPRISRSSRTSKPPTHPLSRFQQTRSRSRGTRHRSRIWLHLHRRLSSQLATREHLVHLLIVSHRPRSIRHAVHAPHQTARSRTSRLHRHIRVLEGRQPANKSNTPKNKRAKTPPTIRGKVHKIRHSSRTPAPTMPKTTKRKVKIIKIATSKKELQETRPHQETGISRSRTTILSRCLVRIWALRACI